MLPRHAAGDRQHALGEILKVVAHRLAVFVGIQPDGAANLFGLCVDGLHQAQHTGRVSRLRISTTERELLDKNLFDDIPPRQRHSGQRSFKEPFHLQAAAGIDDEGRPRNTKVIAEPYKVLCGSFRRTADTPFDVFPVEIDIKERQADGFHVDHPPQAAPELCLRNPGITVRIDQTENDGHLERGVGALHLATAFKRRQQREITAAVRAVVEAGFVSRRKERNLIRRFRFPLRDEIDIIFVGHGSGSSIDHRSLTASALQSDCRPTVLFFKSHRLAVDGFFFNLVG